MSARPTESRWPSAADWLTALLISAAAFACEAYVAIAIGHAENLGYDGIAYANHARMQYYQFDAFWSRPSAYLLQFYSYIAGLWSAFIVLTYALVGVGEVQAYFSGFWGMLFFVVLVVWLVRVLGSRPLSILLGAATALLPFNSPAASMAIAWLLGLDPAPRSVLADLRPDRLAHVFLLWSVLPLLMHRRDVCWSSMGVTGIACAASVLTKGSTSPISVGCWGLTIFFALAQQRPVFSRKITFRVAFGVLVFGAALLPWYRAGGFENVAEYFRNTYLLKPFYEKSATTGALQHFPFTQYLSLAGYYFTWPVFVAVCATTAWGAVKALQAREPAAMPVLSGLALVAAGVVLALLSQPLSNAYLVMPLYFLLWTAFVAAAAVVWRTLGERAKKLGVAAMLFLLAVPAAAVAGVWAWPQDDLRRQGLNRALMLQITSDLRRHLSNRDAFASLALSSGFPLIFQFRMTTDSTGAPVTFRFWPPDGPALAEDPAARRKFIADLESQCKLILTFKEKPDDPYFGKARMSDFFLPHFDTIYDYLRSGRSRFRPVREYAFPEPGRLFYPAAPGTVVMYLRDDVAERFK
jgi:hypothetical protein